MFAKSVFLLWVSAGSVCLLLEGVWSVDTLMRARDLPVLVEDALAVDTRVQAVD